MAKRSFFYNWTFFYEMGMQMIPGKKFKEKYQYIASQIHDHEKVLEPACGPAILSGFMKNRNHYSGFDINEKFIRHAKKRGLNAYVGDALDSASYQDSDVVVICDAMHHIGLEFEKEMLKLALNCAKSKIVICEPHIDNYFSYLPGWLPKRKELLKWWYNFIERDGANKVDVDHLRRKEELSDLLMDGFGIIPKNSRKTLHEMGENLIATYHLL